MSKPDLRLQIDEIIETSRMTGDAYLQFLRAKDDIIEAFANHLEEVDGRLPEANPREWADNQPQVAWTIGYEKAIQEAHQTIQQEIKSLRGEV